MASTELLPGAVANGVGPARVGSHPRVWADERLQTILNPRPREMFLFGQWKPPNPKKPRVFWEAKHPQFCSPIIRVTWMLVETFQFFGMDFVKPGFRQRWSLFFIAISQKFQLRRMKFLSFGRPWKLSATFCRIPVQLEVPENSSKNPS